MNKISGILVENRLIDSSHLNREVKVDFFLPRNVSDPDSMTLLLINDGQDLEKMGFQQILEQLYDSDAITPLLCAGIHAGKNRKMEYGISAQADYKGRGAHAGEYTRFVLKELLPLIHHDYFIKKFREQSFAGFSLGGLMALDIVWNHPKTFSKVGVFSGSLWWRSRALSDGYLEERDRIMHAQIQKGHFHAGLKFFFQTGALDEIMDRNHNGIIDSIDDTLGLMDELEQKGYRKGKDIHYLEYEDGRHDVDTWARAMPEFLKWGWGKTRD